MIRIVILGRRHPCETCPHESHFSAVEFRGACDFARANLRVDAFAGADQVSYWCRPAFSEVPTSARIDVH